MRTRSSLFRRFLHANDASVILEFALLLPILVLMFLGVVELSRYFLYKEKVESAMLQSLDIINQNTNVNALSLDNLFEALPDMMQPYAFKSPQFVITEIVRPRPAPTTCKPVAAWQYPSATHSKVASGRNTPANTGNISLRNNDSVMAFEIYTKYEPLLSKSFLKQFFGSPSITVYKVAYAHGRYGSFLLDPKTGNKIKLTCIRK